MAPALTQGLRQLEDELGMLLHRTVGMVLPFAGRTDTERCIVINSIGATWEGNQTWLITVSGALFASWPLIYAAAHGATWLQQTPSDVPGPST